MTDENAAVQWRTDWENAPRDGSALLVHDGKEPHKTRWGKAAHVPLYGFLDLRITDPEDTDILPSLVGWLPLDALPPSPGSRVTGDSDDGR